jgi:L-ascorbate metabolism protein UlaG (beta-lactamase superfamily)
MSIDPALIEVSGYDGPGFRPLVDHGAWRVAVLNHIDHLDPQNLKDMQRHDETDEVFVLLKGRCILFVGDGADEAGTIHAVDMAPLTLYNVKRGVWHNHTLTPDASVLVIENRDTTVENSPFCPLSAAQNAEMVTATRRLWGPAPA